MSHLLDPKLVIVPPSRQRREFKDDHIDGLISSFKLFAGDEPLHVGQLQPIVITRDNNLIAGECRLRAMLKAGSPKIKVDYRDEVAPRKLKAMEYEENAKRQNLTWQESCIAVVEFHEFQLEDDPEWTLEATTAALNFSSAGSISRYLQVGRELLKGDERVAQAGSISAAYNIIERRNQRAVDNEISQLGELLASPLATEVSAPVQSQSGIATFDTTSKPSSVVTLSDAGEYTQAAPSAIVPKSVSVEDTILIGSFLDWAPTYSGRKFNFLHCDFPYGVGHHKTEQGGSNEWGSYEDTPEVYWELCRSLATNIDRILFSSAHVMFWFSMNFYQETIEFFNKHTDLIVQPFPLIWHKSDGRGIAPDVQRQPRRIYETALLMSRGDRKIIKIKNNLYSCPTSKELHISEKPEPMLRHFFEMFVDNLSEVLDPTCGSGGAIRAAEALGATRAQGLELNPEYADTARTALRSARNKSRLAEMV